jgi:hypothetical protein
VTRARAAEHAIANAMAIACSREAPPPPATAPVAPAVAVTIEPPRLRIGDVATIEVAVVTPPGFHVAPIHPPESVAGLWLLDAEALPVESAGAREVRRTRIRVRAREVGATEWPALSVEIDAPDGTRTTLATEKRPLEVVSVLPLFPERTEPFAYRLPAAPASATRPAVAAAIGAGATLAALALGLLVRGARRRGREQRAALAAVAAAQPWVEARAALAAARALDAGAWRVAGAAGAHALRHYIASRFGIAAAESAAVEELGALPQPFLRAERWRAALDCLRDLDGDRFRARPEAESAARVAAALAAAEAFVRSTSRDDGGAEGAAP